MMFSVCPPCAYKFCTDNCSDNEQLLGAFKTIQNLAHTILCLINDITPCNITLYSLGLLIVDINQCKYSKTLACGVVVST